MSSNTIKYDDASGLQFVRPVQDGPTQTSYPFIENGDRAARIYSRSLLQREAYYRPIIPGTETDAAWSGGDPLAYNLPDSTPQRIGIGDLIRFTRSYARIPATQTTYPGSRYFQLPTLTNNYGTETALTVFDVSSGKYVGNGYYNSGALAIYTDYQQSLYGATKTCGSRTAGYATAGTFTLTYGANTTAALNYNDSGATITTALNGLASVTAAGLVASVSTAMTTTTGGGLVISWTTKSTLTPVTMNGGSLTMTTSNHPVTQINSSTSQDILLADHVTVTSHGLNTALALAVVYNRSTPAVVVLPTASWGSVDSNTLWLPTASTYGDAAHIGTYNRSFQTGRSCLLRVKAEESFALPGVTPGITTASDISTSFGLQNPEDFVAAMLLTGWQTYESEGPAQWMGGPIYRLATTKINVSDIG